MMTGSQMALTKVKRSNRKDMNRGMSKDSSTNHSTRIIGAIEQRSNQSVEGFERAYLAMSIGCFVIAFVFLAFVAAKMILGDDFVNAVLSFFGV